MKKKKRLGCDNFNNSSEVRFLLNLFFPFTKDFTGKYYWVTWNNFNFKYIKTNFKFKSPYERTFYTYFYNDNYFLIISNNNLTLPLNSN